MENNEFYSYLSDLQKGSDFKEMNFEQIKNELEELYESEILFEELDKGSFFGDSSMHINNDFFMESRILISEIREKKEINEQLGSLCYHVNLLRAEMLRNDRKKATQIVSKIMKNKYHGINSIIDELDKLKKKINSLEDVHSKILQSGLSIDIKAVIEQNFRKKQQDLDNLHKKQKNVLINLSNIFLKLTKESFFKDKK
ncbi:hypothetical protein ISS07_02255 [Candidatus Woesearchaeota archaeon]|nr:hypothetical protein [Candidatus Woesearchaeota archaeon]